MEIPAVLDDAALVARIRGGDTEGWRLVYDRYADRCYTLCFSVLRDDEAADAVHDAFIAAMAGLGGLRDPSALRPWLLRIAWNEAVRRSTRRARTRPTDDRVFTDRPSADPSPEDAAHRRELAELIRAATDGLTENERAVLDLDVHQGLSSEEVAAVVGLTASNARKLAQRVRARAGRALGALLVASRGAQDCAALRAELAGWDGRFNPVIRKRVARHVDGCRVCDENRSRLTNPVALLGSAPLLPAPPSVAQRVFDVASAAPASTAAPVTAQPAHWTGSRWRTAVLAGSNSAARIAGSGDGGVVVAWTGPEDRVYARVRDGGAGPWSSTEELTTGFDSPRGVIDALEMPDGRVCVFWAGYATGDPFTYLDSYGLYQRCRYGDRWSELHRVADKGPDNWVPAVAPDGTVHAPWSRSSSEIGYQAQTLSDGGTNAFPMSAVDNAGRLHLLWWNGEQGYLHRRSETAAAAGGPPNRSARRSNAPRLTADHQGGLFLTATTGTQLLVQHWTIDDGWTAPRGITGEQANNLTYTALSDAPGGCAAIVWDNGASLLATFVDTNANTRTATDLGATHEIDPVYTDVTVDSAQLTAAITLADGSISAVTGSGRC